MTDPNVPHDEALERTDPDLGYYSPPPPGVEAPAVARPYEYVSAALRPAVPASPPTPQGTAAAYAAPALPPAYAASPGGPSPTSLPPGYATTTASSAYPAAPGPGRDPRPKGVAVTGFVLALVGFILAFVPITAGFAILLTLIAFIVSIAALASARRGGKGFAGTGLALSILGGLIALVVTVLQAFGAFGSSSGYEPSEPYVEPYVQDEEYEEPLAGDFAAPGTDGIPDGDVALATPVALTVAETAFGAEASGSGIWIVVVLDNPNADHIFAGVDIGVRAVDASGAEIATASEHVNALQGRSALVLHNVMTGTTAVSAIEVTVPEAATATVSPSIETGSFTVTDTRISAGEDGTRVSGYVTGHFASDLWYARVTVVARDSGGRIVGGEPGSLGRVAADGSPAFFSAWFVPPLAADVSAETYPAP
ncbi:DUF308 domain-containing protein [Microbacterium sp. NPDC058389]|uniref:DUF308 domain-containing protein n=1 Tax=Microbacterium sp. NPDC058389 TaxID=3346475 RepID=UPI00364C6A9E